MPLNNMADEKRQKKVQTCRARTICFAAPIFSRDFSALEARHTEDVRKTPSWVTLSYTI